MALVLNLIGPPGANKKEIAENVKAQIRTECAIIDIEEERNKSPEKYIGQYYDRIRDKIMLTGRAIIVSTGLSAQVRLIARENTTLTVLCMVNRCESLKRMKERHAIWQGEEGGFDELYDACNKRLPKLYNDCEKIFSNNISVATDEIISLLAKNAETVAPLVNEQAAKRAARWKKNEYRNFKKKQEELPKEDRKQYSRQTNEHRNEATKAVKDAIRKGRLIRAKKCEQCNTIAYTEAHHRSYKREDWLDIEWLCKDCHRKRHG